MLADNPIAKAKMECSFVSASSRLARTALLPPHPPADAPPPPPTTTIAAFVVRPLFKTLVEIAPKLHSTLGLIDANSAPPSCFSRARESFVPRAPSPAPG